MLFMLWTLDFLFVLVDYFIYLLEPIFVHLSSFLSFCQRRNKYSQTWPWLLQNFKATDMSSKGLDLEIEEFYELRVRHQRKISLTRSDLAHMASEVLKNQWPWLGVHCVFDEPSERLVDCFGHDLGLVADWECCRMSIDWHQIQTDQDEASELELVARSACGEKMLVRIGSEQSHVLIWQLISLRSRDRDELRAALVFYYVQLHPKLARLHNLLAHLLDDIVEPSSDQLNKEAIFNSGDQKNHLSRYALLLMVMANIQNRKDSKATLTEHLVDFLLSYSELSCSGHRIAPKSIKLKNHIGLELVEERVQYFGDRQRLEVLDPVELATAQCGKTPDGLANLIAQLQSSSINISSVEEANITRDFRREKELAKRCRKLSEQLKCKLALVKCNGNAETILSSLLVLSGAPISNYAKPRFAKLLDQKAPLPNPKEAFISLQQWFWPRKVTNKNEHRQQFGRRKNGRQMNFSWRKVIANLLYLFIFLLIRDELIRQVIRWRALFNEQAREDWIQLKHQLFPRSQPG